VDLTHHDLTICKFAFEHISILKFIFFFDLRLIPQNIRATQGAS
jgi:hypothetical protein